jgi:hypothetical protein
MDHEIKERPGRQKREQLGVNLWFSQILKQERLGDYQLRKMK